MVVLPPIVKERDRLYTGDMDIEQRIEGYMLPPLSDEFLYQVIFCMEDQANEYCVDLKDGVVTEVEFVADRREIEPQRFLDLPPWYPSDGFRTMEKFVSTLRNPLYRERLRQVLQSGKGVFRQFKDVLHEQPTLERLWFYYKDREIRRRIFHWYERHDEAFRLARLGEEVPDDGSSELVREDFTITDEIDSYRDDVAQLKELAIRRVMELEIPTARHMAVKLREAWREHPDDAHVVALSLEGEFAGFIRYHIQDPEQVAVIRCFAVHEEYQGLGVFRYLFDSLCSRLSLQGVRDVVVPLAGDALKIERMFDAIGPSDVTHTISVSVPRWTETFSHESSKDFA